ncbi:MAG: FAD-binding oxidoreductase [Leptolyngbya sp. SIO4C1]|nr:FAD-binding oxidoreductase [Leptolyngbya sp. SIO4C1]
MQTVDWIVVGNGIAGAALSYELVKQQQSVLLIDAASSDSGTRYSYGGIAYWSGTDETTKALCQAGIERHRQLSDELGAETEFRELDLLLTIAPEHDLEQTAQQYAHYAIPPQLISAAEACDREPQLNRDAIAGAMLVKHGHVHPVKTVEAYNQAFRRLGGQHIVASVSGLVRVGEQVTGVITPTQAYAARQVAIAAGAYSRPLLAALGLQVPLYYTHAEIIETPPVELTLQSLIMPANSQRFELEAKVSQPEKAALWQTPNQVLAAPILDAGAIQFLDGSIRIGQISRVHTTLDPSLPAAESEAALRAAIAAQLPALAAVPGSWRHCRVTFSRDGLPLIGPVPGIEGLQLFSGFTSPFAMLMPVAERFARWAVGAADPLIETMLAARFFD